MDNFLKSNCTLSSLPDVFVISGMSAFTIFLKAIIFNFVTYSVISYVTQKFMHIASYMYVCNYIAQQFHASMFILACVVCIASYNTYINYYIAYCIIAIYIS